MSRVTLAHGAGGRETRELVERVFLRQLDNPILRRAEDAAVIPPARLAVSTDGFTVSPLFFAGGDIGKLAVAGSCNDVAMMGAKPRYLSASFIIEEGFLLADLERIARSFADELKKNGAELISADTKVVPRGKADGLFITTTALGEVQKEGLSPANLQPGDFILASGTSGDHGAAIFAAREGIDLQSDLKSDCASLWPLVDLLLKAELPILALRDATRGGLAAVLNEWALSANQPITVNQPDIPVRREVQGACELMGFEPYSLANEGMMIVAIRGHEEAKKACKLIQSHTLGTNAALIGEVTGKYTGRVALKTAHGTTRFLDMPSGELLPRIC